MTPKRGEIWLVNLDPTVSADICKTCPVIVMGFFKGDRASR